MPQRDEAVFVLHGLDADVRNVRADVFALKLRTLIAGLRRADKFANGRASFEYVIVALKTGSASVTVRQKQKSHVRPQYSSMDTYEKITTSVYNGDADASRYPTNLITNIRQLSRGSMRTFSHGELTFSDHNVIRSDDFLERQSEEAQRRAATGIEASADQYYRGLAIGTFDGELKEIDSRGVVLRGKLILSAGGLEIDCVMNKERVPEAREAFDKRVIVEGLAHYDGEQQLPSRIEIATIRAVDRQDDLTRWRGAFVHGQGSEEDEDEWL
jgi:hypothetical protein